MAGYLDKSYSPYKPLILITRTAQTRRMTTIVITDDNRMLIRFGYDGQYRISIDIVNKRADGREKTAEIRKWKTKKSGHCERFPHDCAYGHYHKQCVFVKYFCIFFLLLLGLRLMCTVLY